MIRPIRLDDAEAVGAMAQELNAAMRALGDKNEGRFDAPASAATASATARPSPA